MEKNCLNKDVKLMFFHASWCGQCKAFTPIVRGAAQEAGVNIVDVDADKDLDICNAYGIMNLPVVIVVNGDKKERIDGIVSKEILLDKINSIK